MAKREISIGAKKYRPYLMLGLGLAYQYGVAKSTTLLDVAARSKLAIPSTLVLFDEAYQDALEIGLLRIESESMSRKLIMHNPDRLIAAFNFPNFEWEFPFDLAIRSAFRKSGDEDADYTALVKRPVDARDPAQLAAAFSEVWSASLKLEGDWRRDLLLMKQIPATQSGVALTAAADPDDAVQTPDNNAIHLPKLRAFARADRDLPAWQIRLQTQLRDLRVALRRFGSSWAVDWADDGEKCYILSIRALRDSSI